MNTALPRTCGPGVIPRPGKLYASQTHATTSVSTESITSSSTRKTFAVPQYSHERADLAAPHEARIRTNGHNRTVEDLDEVSARPTVSAFGQGQVYLEHFNAGDAGL